MIYIGWWRLGRYLKSGFGQLRCNCNGKSMWNSCTLCTGRAQKPALNMSFLWGWWRKGQFCESEKSPWFPDPALKPGLAWCSDCRGGTRTRQPRQGQKYRELQKYNPNSKNTRSVETRHDKITLPKQWFWRFWWWFRKLICPPSRTPLVIPLIRSCRRVSRSSPEAAGWQWWRLWSKSGRWRWWAQLQWSSLSSVIVMTLTGWWSWWWFSASLRQYETFWGVFNKGWINLTMRKLLILVILWFLQRKCFWWYFGVNS